MNRVQTHRGITPRVVGGKLQKSTFFIVCEGEKTEPYYFQAFGKRPSVYAIGIGKNTKSLVDAAKRMKDKYPGYDQYWCVFDRDSFPAQHFNNAIQDAATFGFSVAYSNEAFEIWYLLHFDFHTSALSRNLYPEKLSEKFGKKYLKNDSTMFDTLKDRLPQAVKFARKLLKEYQPQNPEKDNPSTTVHLLVQQLRAAGYGPPIEEGEDQ